MITNRSELEKYFPSIGPCVFCDSGLDQRHRVLDAICYRYSAGESIQALADDYGVTIHAVKCALDNWKVM